MKRHQSLYVPQHISRALIVVLMLLCATTVCVAQVSDAVKRAKSSVVTIHTYDAQDNDKAQGSGFFISPTRVITNRHVVEGADKAKITLADGDYFNVKGLIAEDAEWDLVMLEVAIPASSHIRSLALAKKLPEEGDKVFVWGSPMGQDLSLSDGTVSSIRTLPQPGGKVIQITAPISHGSSGSPVFNGKGEVVGVATYSLVDGQNINFAIPFERVELLEAGPLRELATVGASAHSSSDSATSYTTPIANNTRMLQRAMNLYGWSTESMGDGVYEKLVHVADSLYSTDLRSDFLKPSQAREIVRAAFGVGSAEKTYREDNTSIRDPLESLSATVMFVEDSLLAEVVHFESDIVSAPREVYRTLAQGWEYTIYARGDQTISDLDVELYTQENGDWKLVAQDSEKDNHPLISYAPHRTGLFKIVVKASTFVGEATAGHYALVVFHD